MWYLARSEYEQLRVGMQVLCAADGQSGGRCVGGRCPALAYAPHGAGESEYVSRLHERGLGGEQVLAHYPDGVRPLSRVNIHEEHRGGQMGAGHRPVREC